MSRIHKTSSLAALQASDIAICCRWCLTTGGKMSPVFGASLDLMLRSIASLEMSEGDEYPQQACNSCIKTLSISYRFQQMVLSNYSILVDVLKKKTKLSTAEEFDTGQEILDARCSLPPEININAEIIREEGVCEKTDEVENSVSQHEDEEGVKEESTASVEEQTDRDAGVNVESTVSVEEVTNAIKCPHCPVMLTNQLNLKIHLITHREPCKECKKPIPRRGLARHMLTHTCVKPHACKFCQRRFADPTNLARHVATHSREGRGKESLCPLCGKKFKWRTSLNRHMRHHTGSGLHKCRVCSKAFSSPSTLKMHMFKHQGRRFECRVCATTFTQQSSLIRHSRAMHCGVRRQFACRQCGHLFMYKASMELHMRRAHRGEKPYECRQCNRTFAYQRSLEKHKSSHDNKDCKKSLEVDIRTTSVLYLCMRCGHKFDSEEDMKIHTKSCAVEPETPVAPKPPTNQCEICAQVFPKCEELLTHYSSEHNQWVYRASAVGLNPIPTLEYLSK